MVAVKFIVSGALLTVPLCYLILKSRENFSHQRDVASVRLDSIYRTTSKRVEIIKQAYHDEIEKLPEKVKYPIGVNETVMCIS